MKKRLISLMLALALLISCVFVNAEDEVQAPAAEQNEELGENTSTEITDDTVSTEEGPESNDTGDEDETNAGTAGNPSQTTEVNDIDSTEDDVSGSSDVIAEDDNQVESETDANESGYVDLGDTSDSSSENGENEQETLDASETVSDETETASNGSEGALDTGDASEEAVENTASEEEQIDYTRPCKYSPAFTQGYVELADNALLYAELGSEQAFATVKKGTAYAVRRYNAGGSNDKLLIAYADSEGEYTAYVSAAQATPMNENAVELFLSRLPADNTHFQDALKTIPLAELTIILIEDSDLPDDTEDTVENGEGAVIDGIENSETSDENETVIDGTGNEAPVDPTDDDSDSSDVAVEIEENVTDESDGTADIENGDSVSGTQTDGGDEIDEPVTEDEVVGDIEKGESTLESGDDSLIDSKTEDAAENAQTVDEDIEDVSTSAPVMMMSMRSAPVVAGASVDILFDDFDRKIGLGDKLTVSACAVDENGIRTADEITFTVEGTSASISADEISGLSLGSFTLVASNSAGLTKTLDMNVVSAPAEVSLEKTSLTVGVNGTATLSYRVNEGTAGSASWFSSDESVAKVNKNGIITGISSGTAVITVMTYNGLSDACAVSVMGEPEDLQLSVSSITINENETVHVDASFTGDVFGNVYCDDITGDAEIEFTSLGGGAFSIKGVYSGEASVLFYVYNKTTDQTFFARLDITVLPSVSSIVFLNPRTQIGYKETVDLEPVAYDARGNQIDEALSLSTSYKSHVSVTNGKVYGQYYGTATITATSSNGVSASIGVKTVKAPSSIKLNKTSVTLGMAEEVCLEYKLSDGSASAITWKSSDPSVATVDRNGNVKAVGAGTATVTAYTFVSGKQASCSVTVNAAPEGVAFSSVSYSLLEGMKLDTSLVFTPAEATGALKYVIEDTFVATVDENGVVTGINSGRTTLNVTVHSNLTGEDFSAACEIVVSPAPASIVIETERRTIGKGETLNIVCAAFDKYGDNVDTVFTLTSSKPKIVRIDGNSIYGLSTGSADITIKAANGFSTKISVKVVSAPTKVILSQTNINLTVGQSTQVNYKLNSTSTVSAITWNSQNSDVAEVIDGVITAKAPGTTKIRCSTYLSSIYAEVTVNVFAAPTAIVFESDALSVYEGQTIKPAVTLLPAGAKGDVVFELAFSDGEEIATLSGDEIKGVYSGACTLTAKVLNSETGEYITGSNVLNVLPAVRSIAFRSDRTTIGEKETVDLKPVAYDARGNVIDAEIRLSIKGSYAKLSGGTSVYGSSTGTSTITATAENGVSVTQKFKVVSAPKSITIKADSLHIAVGESAALRAVTNAQDAADVTWSSNEETVFTVNETGIVTAVGYGTAEITATSYNGKIASITLNAVHAPTSISFAEASYTVSEGGSVKTSIVFEPEGSTGNVSYSITDTDSENQIASVDENGIVYGKSSGSATLIATVTDNESGSVISATALINVTAAPASIVITGRTTIGAGESVDLMPVAYDGRGNVIDTAFTLKSASTYYVKVNGGTTIKGSSKGSTNVTVTAANGCSTVVKITVASSPSKVKLHESSLILQIGELYTLRPYYDEGQVGAMRFTSDNPEVVSVDENGILTANKAGTAKITVRSYNDKTAKLTVTVNASPIEIRFASDTIKVVAGETALLHYAFTPADAFSDVTFTSSDTHIVSVDKNGKLTAGKIGTATVTAQSYSVALGQEISATVNIEVCKYPTSVDAGTDTVTLGVGQTYTVDPKAYDPEGNEINTAYTLSTSNKSYASVNGYTIKGAKYGTADITVTATGGSKDVIHVVIMNSPSDVKLDKELSMSVGETFTIKPIFKDKQFGSVTWTSSDESIARIDADGNITALKKGVAKISVKTYNGKTATCTLTVCDAPTGISFKQSSYTVSEYETVATGITLTPAGSFAHPVYTIEYDSDDVIATVDAVGKVTGVNAGSAVLTATVTNHETGMSYSASATVTVKPAAVTIKIDDSRLKIGVGETIDLKPRAYDSRGNLVETTFTLKSSSSYQLNVSGTKIKGLKTSKPTVTITSANGTSLKVEITVVSSPSTVTLSTRSSNIPVNNLTSVTAKVNNVPDTPLHWTSSDESVATVNDSGVVNALTTGEVTITATTYNGKKASIKLNVLPEAEDVSFDGEGLRVGLGSSGTKTAILPEGTSANVIYASRNPFVARVNASTGEVTGVRVGTTTIVATIKNASTGRYYMANYTVTVTPVPASIGFAQERRVMGSGEKLALEAIAYDANGNVTGGGFSYKSSNTNYVTVSSDGVLIAKKTGSVTITVTCYNGVKENVNIRVVSSPSSIKLSAEDTNVVVGYTAITPKVTLSPTAAVGKISFASEDETVATVDENGTITGISYGSTRIKATTYNGKSATITVNVFEAPAEIYLSAEEITLGEGQFSSLSHSFEVGQYSKVTFTSDDESVAKVDASGKISALKAGIANITVQAVNGVKAVCTVTVKPAPDSVSFSENVITIGRYQTFDAADYVVLPDGTEASFSFKTESSYILESKSEGLFRSKNTGTTRIKVTTHNGKTATMTVKVIKAASSFTVAISQDVLYEGSIFELTPVFPASSTAQVTFESSNAEVVSVSYDGSAKALSAGTAVITATSHTGVTVKTTLHVYRHVGSVSLSESEITLTHYDSLQLEAVLTPDQVYDPSLTWTSSDPDKVSVNENGLIEALAVTQTPVTVTATSNDTGVFTTCLVSVEPVHVTSIELSASEITLERGRSASVAISFTPANADDKSVVWSSSAPSVAVVDNEGNITAISDSGTAVISCVTNDGGIRANVTVATEKVHLLSAAFNESAILLTHYDEANLSYVVEPFDADISNVLWSSSAPEVLSVDQNGHANALSVGTAKITLTLTDSFGFAYTCTANVTVEPVHVSEVVLSTEEIHLRIGRSKPIEAAVRPDNADNKALNWASGNSSIVTLQQQDNGAVLVTGSKAGETVITATSVDGGIVAECAVVVFEPLVIEAVPNFTHNTLGNDIIWTLAMQNAIGNVNYSIVVKKDGSTILNTTSYDPAQGIVLRADAVGTYTVSVSIIDGESDEASCESTVTVSEAFTFTSGNIVWEYVILNAQGDMGAAVRLVSCPAGTTTITVPATMDGAPVVRIDTEAFMGMAELTRVNIPESVTEIGARAFKGCTALTDIVSY